MPSKQHGQAETVRRNTRLITTAVLNHLLNI